ncbi:MAG: lysozyme inhibitor LprI family protein [Hyphomicrobiales bacterium]
MKSSFFKFIFTAIALTFILPNATNAVDQNAIDCESPMLQVDMNYCAYQDYMAADAELNIIYKRTKKSMEEVDKYLLGDFKGAAKSLLHAQRAWIKYRDLACDTEGYSFRGGSMEPLIVSTCKERLTLLRTEDLKSLISMN